MIRTCKRMCVKINENMGIINMEKFQTNCEHPFCVAAKYKQQGTKYCELKLQNGTRLSHMQIPTDISFRFSNINKFYKSDEGQRRITDRLYRNQSAVELNIKELQHQIKQGLLSNSIQLVDDFGIRCKIGEQSFYFQDDCDMSLEDYNEQYTIDDTVTQLAIVLHTEKTAEKHGIDCIEQAYYRSVLNQLSENVNAL